MNFSSAVRCLFSFRNIKYVKTTNDFNQQNLCRTFSYSIINYKKRKEDPKPVEIVKTKNKIITHGVVDVWRNITVTELAKTLNKSLDHVQEVMLYCKGAEQFMEPHSKIEDIKILREIVTKCGFKSKFIADPTKVIDEVEQKDKDIYPRPPAPIENLKSRAPVVTIMGHVDHGKTTLLDTLRGASVAAGEAGGITQHIGAFTVVLENGEQVTFLDTPGHAAFSAMRARGANCTDIIVLVVAADDSVMQQTKEVIHLANESKVPIIVAINKIDKSNANVARTKKDLLQMGLALEEYGGDVQVVGISALLGTNLSELIDAITTQATLMDLKSEFIGLVEGVVIESKIDTRRGKLATIIVTRGTLRKSCVLVSGQVVAKVRNIFSHSGEMLTEAVPGTPVEIIGWRDLPEAGDIILEVESEKLANSIVKYRQSVRLEQKADADLDVIRKKQEEHNKIYNEKREARRISGRFRDKTNFRPKEHIQSPDDHIPKINIILKGDVHGSVEALLDVLDTYGSIDKCRLSVVHYGVGDIIDSDIELAKAFNAIIYAFSVKPSKSLKQSIPKSIIIKEFNIIYRLIDDLKDEINKKLEPIDVEEIIGEANVLQIFKINEGRKEVTVLGCRCTKGVLKKKLKYKLIRPNSEPIFAGELESMRHLKNEVDSIKKDIECGLRLIDQTIEAQPGDTLIGFSVSKQPQKTDWDPGF